MRTLITWSYININSWTLSWTERDQKKCNKNLCSFVLFSFIFIENAAWSSSLPLFLLVHCRKSFAPVFYLTQLLSEKWDQFPALVSFYFSSRFSRIWQFFKNHVCSTSLVREFLQILISREFDQIKDEIRRRPLGPELISRSDVDPVDQILPGSWCHRRIWCYR